MSENIKVSLIVPVYNGQDKIKDCLKSISSQSLKGLEVILIDDGSSDESVKLIKSWIKKQSNEGLFINLHEKENSGAANTRNLGISLAKGEYIMFADQDDSFPASYCETFYHEIKKSQADIVVGGYRRLTNDNKEILRVNIKDFEWSKFIVVSPWAHIYKTDFIKSHSIEFFPYTIGEDVYFNLIAYSKAVKIKCISYAGYIWRYNEESVSNSKQNHIDSNINPLFLLDKIYNDMDCDYRKNSLIEYFFLRYICWYILFSFRGSQKSEIKRVRKELTDWLRNHYPGYSKNPYLKLKKPKGESTKIHTAVTAFYAMDKVKVLTPILGLFGK